MRLDEAKYFLDKNGVVRLPSSGDKQNQVIAKNLSKQIGRPIVCTGYSHGSYYSFKYSKDYVTNKEASLLLHKDGEL